MGAVEAGAAAACARGDGANGAGGSPADDAGTGAPSMAMDNGDRGSSGAALSQLRTVDLDTPQRLAKAERLMVAKLGSSRSCSSAWVRPTGRIAVTVTM